MQRDNRVVRWYPHHLDMCELNEFDAANIELFADYKQYLETYANAGLAFSVLDRDGISAMGARLCLCIGGHWPFLTTFPSK